MKQDISLMDKHTLVALIEVNRPMNRHSEQQKAHMRQPESLIQRNDLIFGMTKLISIIFVNILMLPQIKLYNRVINKKRYSVCLS